MSRFGSFLFGATEFFRRILGGSCLVACLGDPASHPGSIVSSGQDGTVKAGGDVIAVEGALFACQISGHGTTPIYSIIQRSRINGKLIITANATAGCGARMNPIDRRVRAW